MVAPAPYLHFDGTARAALEFYRAAFGGEVEVHTFAEFGRTDGEGDRVAHGGLRGPVDLFAADTGEGEVGLLLQGVLLSLLGAADASVLTEWFTRLAAGGLVVEPLEPRPWGAHDGQVQDRFGVTWLIGYEGSTPLA